MYIKGVLISTYWNVNDVERFRKKSNHFVLISTYWNVNVKAIDRQIKNFEGFNLNLLECKCFYMLNNLLCTSVLISTYWNVNSCQRTISHCTATVLISTYWNVNVQSAYTLHRR